MQNGIEGKSALLIGEEFIERTDVISAISALSLELKVVKTGYDGLSELYQHKYEIVLIGSDVADIRQSELCRQIKVSSKHSEIPVVCVFSQNYGVPSVLNSLHSGADDCFAGTISSVQLMAKLEWLLMRGRSAAALRQYYCELRTRQAQTLGVVRATADLMESIDSDFRGENCYGSQELVAEKLEIGLGMIRSLASILENQIESFDISELIEQTDSPNGNELYRDHRSVQTGMFLELAG